MKVETDEGAEDVKRRVGGSAHGKVGVVASGGGEVIVMADLGTEASSFISIVGGVGKVKEAREFTASPHCRGEASLVRISVKMSARRFPFTEMPVPFCSLFNYVASEVNGEEGCGEEATLCSCHCFSGMREGSVARWGVDFRPPSGAASVLVSSSSSSSSCETGGKREAFSPRAAMGSGGRMRVRCRWEEGGILYVLSNGTGCEGWGCAAAGEPRRCDCLSSVPLFGVGEPGTGGRGGGYYFFSYTEEAPILVYQKGDPDNRRVFPRDSVTEEDVLPPFSSRKGVYTRGDWVSNGTRCDCVVDSLYAYRSRNALAKGKWI